MGGRLGIISSGGPCAHDANNLMHAAFGNGVFVAVGGWSGPRVVVSPDGKAWEEIEAAHFAGVKGAANRVLFVDGQLYLMTQMGFMLRSRDGKKWERVGEAPLTMKPKMQRVRDLAFGKGVFVGVGDFGAISVSADMGKTWTVTTASHHGEERAWPSIEFGAGVFVIAGEAGYTATSKDGVKWENETTHDGEFAKVGDVCWTGKEFYALGRPVAKGPVTRLISKDGIAWTARKHSWKGEPAVVWRFGTTYYGCTDDFFKGNTASFRSMDGETWEPLENAKGYSARWLASNQPPAE